MDWVWDISPGVWAAILTPVIISIISAFTGKPVPPDKEGFTPLRSTFLLWVLGYFSIAMGLLFAAMPFWALSAKDQAEFLMFGIVGPLLSILMWYGVYSIFIVRVRFNSDVIEYRGLLGTKVVPWAHVFKIVDSSSIGTYVKTKSGRLIIWKLLRGFPQLVEEARKHNVEVDAAL